MQNRKLLTALIALFMVNFLYAENPKVTIVYKGNTYNINVGDTVKLGYGSNPYGSFMFLMEGASKALPKEASGTINIVTKLKYYKSSDTYEVTMKSKNWWFYTFNIQQAIDKKEITRINNIDFNE